MLTLVCSVHDNKENGWSFSIRNRSLVMFVLADGKQSGKSIFIPFSFAFLFLFIFACGANVSVKLH